LFGGFGAEWFFDFGWVEEVVFGGGEEEGEAEEGETGDAGMGR
jgi:hypothetical protein